jgi:branched-chain amino acid transport system ATP-binding protein
MADTASSPGTSTPGGLVVNELRAGYGRREVLHSISFALHPAKITVLLGANGAGKSTTVKAIVGAVKVSHGSVSGPDGTGVAREPAGALRQGVALVPEGGRVFAEFSVEENLKLGGYLNKKADGELGFVFDLFPVLKTRLSQKASTLSGGERQMLAIGRTLMSDPRVLLLDEPFLGIAPILVGRIVGAIERIAKEKGVPILLVEQDSRALALASEVLVLRLGEIVLRQQDASELMTAAGMAKLEELYIG